MANSAMELMDAPQGIFIRPRVYIFTPGYIYSPQVRSIHPGYIFTPGYIYSPWVYIYIHPRVYVFTPGSLCAWPSFRYVGILHPLPLAWWGMDSFVCVRAVSELRVSDVYVWYASVSE